MKIGEILVRQNSITPEQLQIALWVQKIWGGLIGRILCSRGYVSEPELVSALSFQLGVPAVVLHDRPVPDGLCRLFPWDFCLSHLLVPFAQDPDTGALSVAMADPRDAAARRQLQLWLRVPHVVYLCGYNDVTEALYRMTHAFAIAAPAADDAQPVAMDAVVEEMPLSAKPQEAGTVMDAGDILEESELAQVFEKAESFPSIPIESGDFEIVSAEDIGAAAGTEPADAPRLTEDAGTPAQGARAGGHADAPDPVISSAGTHDAAGKTQAGPESGARPGPPPLQRNKPRSS